MKRFIPYAILALTAGVFLCWYAFNHGEAGPTLAPVDALRAPLAFLMGIGIVAALVVTVHLIVFRTIAIMNAITYLAIACGGGLITITVALVLGLWPGSGARAISWEPTPVTNRTAFAKARAHAFGGAINHSGDGEYVMRRSWRLDEYGVKPSTGPARQAGVWRLPWEEYGFPLRCVRSQYHFGWPRPNLARLTEWAPRILSNIAVDRVAFTVNTLIYAALIVLFSRGPRWITWLRRAGTGQCVQCGHRLHPQQDLCCECGHLVTPIERLVPARAHGSEPPSNTSDDRYEGPTH
ncbi:MAG: hypothetical protein HRT46_11800 [Deltaproteobacteria bacterium]|jgi:hypothetical protein|nr:hypothetical protein [Deltaproteobacteria bacterium]